MQRHRDLDLHRRPPGQRRHADGRPAVAAGGAEYVDEHLARRVHHRGLLVKVRRAGHESGHGQDSLDAIKAAELEPKGGEGVEDAETGRPPTVVERHRVTEPARHGEHPVLARQLARRPRYAPVHHDAHHASGRGVGLRDGKAEGAQPFLDRLRHACHTTGMGTNGLRFVRAEPLREEAFAPFGQVIRRGEQLMELRDGEEFALNVLHYEHRPLRCDHLNRHHRATQALIPLGGRPALVVVAAAHLDFGRVEHLESIRAFILDGTAGINLSLATWHWGPYPLMDEVDLVNVQGRGFEDDNEVADLRAAFDTFVDVLL